MEKGDVKKVNKILIKYKQQITFLIQWIGNKQMHINNPKKRQGVW